MDLILDIGSDVTVFPYVSFVVGLLFCFLGRKLMGFIVILFGFIIGYTWGSVLLSRLLNLSLNSSSWIKWAMGLGGAVLGLIAWRLSMFLAGFVIGLFVVRGLFPGIPSVAHTGIAVATGVVTHIYKDPIVALLTSIAGAVIAAGSALIMLEHFGFIRAIAGFGGGGNVSTVVGIVLILIFSITGYQFQSRSLGT